MKSLTEQFVETIREGSIYDGPYAQPKYNITFVPRYVLVRDVLLNSITSKTIREIYNHKEKQWYELYNLKEDLYPNYAFHCRIPAEKLNLLNSKVISIKKMKKIPVAHR